MNILRKILFIALVSAFAYQFVDAMPNEEFMKRKENKVQRDPLGFLDYQKNTLSNIETVISNYGLIGYDRPNKVGSGYFPRGSRNEYIFGGGIWYAAQKKVPFVDSNGVKGFHLNKLVSISYNPSTADSWQTPGRIEDGSLTKGDPEKYKVFFSTDFSRTTGQSLNPAKKATPYWPIWDTIEEDTLGYSRYFGYYQYNENDRRLSKYHKGPAMISGEDIFTTYHDLDISQYEGSLSERRLRGYPMGLQYEFTIYSWGFGQYQNFFFCLYDVINMSKDTLYNCWLAPIMDVDLARSPFFSAGASNDRVSYWYEDPEFNLAYQFTNGEYGEQGQGFGYLGFDFLESPTIIRPPLLDSAGNLQQEINCVDLGNGVKLCDTTYVADENNPDFRFLRKDSAFYDNSSQLGLVTFKNWNAKDDKKDDNARYNYISDGVTDVDFGPGDKRFMMATGPFHMRPGDTSRTVVCIMIATPSKTGDADGTFEDRQGLKALDIFAQEVYDNNFRAPRPPDAAQIKYYKALNNGITIAWDSTSEMSYDREEAGLDFLGYRIDRARVPDLDTFNISQISPNIQYPRGAGPYGWEEVARYQLPFPFLQSTHIINKKNVGVATIDSMFIVGPVTDKNGDITDTSAVRVMRAGQGVVFYPMSNVYKNTNQYIPVIAGINPFAPWGKYYKDFADKEFTENDFANYGARYRFDKSKKLFDSALVGIVRFDPARIPYNPLFFDNYSFEISKAYKEKVLDSIARNGVAVRYKTKEVKLDTITVTVETSVVDSVYFVNTGRILKSNGGEKYIIDGALPIANFATAMNDSVRVKRALDSLYAFIVSGRVTYEFNDFESDPNIKKNVIIPYMKQITNNRTFTDIGDDNKDGILSNTADFDKTEKLINNTPYYYRVLAYDKGDASQPTPVKLNNGVPGVNQIEAFPEAEQVGSKLKFDIIQYDTTKLNGLYDFNFFAIDEDRAKKLFLGDTLELDFKVYWGHSTYDIKVLNDPTANAIVTSAYYRIATLRDLTKDSMLLFQEYIPFNPNGCFSSNELATIMYEDAGVIAGDTKAAVDVNGDTVNLFGIWNNNDYIDFSGAFTTGDFTSQNQCNTQYFFPPAYGTLGFDFRFALAQQGGRYRADKVEILKGDAGVAAYAIDRGNSSRSGTEGTLRSQAVDTTVGMLRVGQNGLVGRDIFPVYGSFNNGPIDATLEFVGGGTEEATLEWGRDDDGKKTVRTKQATFKIKYLDVKVTNNYELNPSNSTKGVKIKNNFEFEPISIDPITTGDILTSLGDVVIRKAYPDPRNLPAMGVSVDDFIGKYNIAAFGHVNVSTTQRFYKTGTVARPANNSDLSNTLETYTGLPQNRYYLSAVDSEGDTLDFINIIDIAGARFAFDKRAIGRLWREDLQTISNNIPLVKDQINYNVKDFEVGDKVRLTTAGGASGLPFPNAKLKVVLKNENKDKGLTDSEMDGIKVVPNPYYITHQNEQTPYQSKLYFTKVPPGSTINIFTASGSLIQTIHHDPIGASTDEGRISVNVWDMIMKNGLRAQSQTLVAQIIAPNGAETMRKFSIVVGTFNIYDK
ncbi:hypothetical protein EP342_02970 [bacterium]|nr:MAG: hypothetical protein EP342_02970 [bacterium]